MSPGDGFGGGSDGTLEGIESCDLVRNRLLDGPSGGGIGGTSEGVTLDKEKIGAVEIAVVIRGIRRTGSDVSVTVEQQFLIPIRGDVDHVGCTICQGAGNVLLGVGDSGERADQSYG